MTARIHVAALAVTQALAFVVAAFSGERWAILPAAASVVIATSTLWIPHRVPTTGAPHVDGYRTQAHRVDDATVEVPSPRPAPKRVLRAEYEQASEAAFGLCAGAASLGGLGAAFGALAWYLRAGWPLPICAGFTIGGAVLLGWWAHCRGTVRAWRDQERERGAR